MLKPSNSPNNKLTPDESQELVQLREKFNQLLISKMDNNANYQLDLSKIWRNTEDLPQLYEQLSDLKKCLDSLRPLSQAQITRLNESFDVEYTYQSNRIEGNTLSKQETNLIVNKGLTIKGKSLNEHLEAINLDERTLLDIHNLVLHGIDRNNAGQYRQDNVTISGTGFVSPMFLQVPQLMEEYFKFYEENKDTMHPVELAAEMHERLVTIHPFVDGNGRAARLVMNLVLIHNGYPLTILNSDNDKRHEYYDSLEVTQTQKDPDKLQFKKFIAENVKHWLFHYLNLLSPNGTPEGNKKGYYFFKRIESLLKK